MDDPLQNMATHPHQSQRGLQRDAAVWECGECGWTLQQDQLPPGRVMSNLIESHGDKYCARPSAWAAD